MSRLRISRNFAKSGSTYAISLVIFFLLLCSTVLAGSERPRAGIGILILRPAFSEQADTLNALVLYETPGIERVAQVNADRLPSLSLSLSVPSGEYAVAAMGKRGDWFRLAYDDAGREGWIQSRDYWNYYCWPDFLPGRVVVLLPDLQATLSKVHQEPLDTSPPLGSISPGQKIRIIDIRDRWALIRSDDGMIGWIRWCDSNGKLVIALEG